MLSRLLKPSALRLLPSHSATSALLEGVARPTRSTLNSLSTNSTNLGKDGRGEEKSGVARRLSNLIQETLEEERHQTIDKRNILANLVSGHVIAPRSLAPEKLLETYPPRPRLDLAYPLGPPTSLTRTHDPFIHLSISPLASPLNPHLRADFCTTMGKILGRGKTGLGRKSQRNVGKAVRRARSMGIVPAFGKMAVGGRRFG